MINGGVFLVQKLLGFELDHEIYLLHFEPNFRRFEFLQYWKLKLGAYQELNYEVKFLALLMQDFV